MINHEMGLFDSGFFGIKSGKQTVEGRLNDLKRSGVQEGDVVRFYRLPEKNEFVDVKVVEILKYDSFRDMFMGLGSDVFGCEDDYLLRDFVRDYREYYPEEKEKELGVLGIRLEVLL